MGTHPIKVNNISTEELAEKIMDTTYAYHLAFFKKFAELYKKKESHDDKKQGYSILSSLLLTTYYTITTIYSLLKIIWKICEPRTNVH